MFVDRRKILIGDIGTGTTIDIALGSKFFPVDNSELIEDKFVKEEVEKSINPIIDYKKIIFKPARIRADGQWVLIDTFKINLNFYIPDTVANGAPLHRGTGSEPGVYADLGFLFDDIFCRTSKFINSFMRISLFSSPYSGQNELLSFADIFTQVGFDQEDDSGIPLPIDECPISFRLGDPVLKPDEIHEGFQIYWFKDLVDNSPNQEYEMYAVVQYFNSSNGRIYDLAPSKDIDPNNINLNSLEGPDGIFYLKIILKNDNGVYKYTFIPNDKQLQPPPGVNLFPSSGGIPTLTFWQITP
ncbi:MAG: hypothetical protein ACW980_20170 [Promethearchaeota archaeon]|jgi:hypothetical protein